MSKTSLIHKRLLVRTKTFSEVQVQCEHYYYIQQRLHLDTAPKPHEMEPLYHFVQSGPPWQHVFVAIQVKDGKLATFDALVICEIDNEPKLDSQIMEYLVAKIEQEPQFLLLETPEQTKFHEEMRMLPDNMRRCQKLAVDEIFTEE